MGPPVYADALVRYRVNGVLYEIPAGYHIWWPTFTEVETIHENNRGGLPDFSFWMPRLRPEMIKTAPPMIVEAIRQRGGSWDADEYEVTVLVPRFMAPGDPDLITPDKRFQNLAGVESGPGDFFAEEFGAQRFLFAKDRISRDSEVTNYRQVPGTQPQFLFWCSGPTGHPLCNGYVYYDLEQLFFYVRFPKEHMKEWRQIVESVHGLILSWRKAQ